MKLPRITGRTMDVRGGYGLDLLRQSPLFERVETEPTVIYRPRFVRALELMTGEITIVTEDQLLVANRQATADERPVYRDFLAMAVRLDALDEPTQDIRLIQYWDFQNQYDPVVVSPVSLP